MRSFFVKKQKSYSCILLLVCIIFLCNSCEKEQQEQSFNPISRDLPSANFDFQEDIQQLLPAKLDTSFRPVVMVHGFLASGDTYASFAQRFTSNGYNWRRMFTFDWNSLAQGQNNNVALDKYIDEILKKTGYKQVELIGHSAGGGLCYNYCKDTVRAKKIAHYVHIGSTPQNSPAGLKGEVPTMNIWSDGDKTVQGADIPGAINIKIAQQDHYQIATSPESFAAIYEFFKQEKPKTTAIAFEANPCIGGKALTFGENQPAIAATVEVFETNPNSGARLSATPVYTTTTDAQGNWAPVIIKPNTTYEIVVKEKEAGKRAIHYYREGFTHNNLFVYLRLIPPPTSLAGILLSGIPNNPEQSALNVFSSSQAIINGRDTLKVNEVIHSTAQTAPASKTLIALFLYDGNKNQKSDLSALPLFSTFPFLNGVDQFFDSNASAPIEVIMNKRRLALRPWKANEHVNVAVFD